MVHLDKVEGQTGSMILHEDGSIISSTGDLSSSEQTAQTIINLITHTLQVDFNSAQQQQQHTNNVAPAGQQQNNGYVNTSVVSDNGTDANSSAVVNKWNRITVSFGDHSYVACLSNKRINVIKKDSSKPPPPPPPQQQSDTSTDHVNAND